MMEIIKKHLYQFWKYQWIDNSFVSPEQKLVDGVFYLDSVAGLIVYKPRDLRDRIRFRNNVINRFDYIAKNGSDREMFHLYKEIRNSYRVSWKANTRTRLRSLVYNAI